jgi:hypothetical protein
MTARVTPPRFDHIFNHPYFNYEVRAKEITRPTKAEAELDAGSRQARMRMERYFDAGEGAKAV